MDGIRPTVQWFTHVITIFVFPLSLSSIFYRSATACFIINNGRYVPIKSEIYVHKSHSLCCFPAFFSFLFLLRCATRLKVVWAEEDKKSDGMHQGREGTLQCVY